MIYLICKINTCQSNMNKTISAHFFHALQVEFIFPWEKPLMFGRPVKFNVSWIWTLLTNDKGAKGWVVSFCKFYEIFILYVSTNIASPWTCALWEHTSFTVASATATDNVVCDSSVPSRMPAVAAATHYGCHMWVHTEITTLALQLTSINEHLWRQFPVKKRLSQISAESLWSERLRLFSSVVLCTLFSTLSNLIKKLQLTVETEGCRDGTLKDEAGGGAASGLNTSHLPPSHPPFWANDPQIRDSSQIHFAPCPSALCVFLTLFRVISTASPLGLGFL